LHLIADRISTNPYNVYLMMFSVKGIEMYIAT